MLSCDPAGCRSQVGSPGSLLEVFAWEREQVHSIAAAQRLTMGRTSLGQVAMALLKASSSDQSPVQNFCRGRTAATCQQLIKTVWAIASTLVQAPMQNYCRDYTATAWDQSAAQQRPAKVRSGNVIRLPFPRCKQSLCTGHECLSLLKAEAKGGHFRRPRVLCRACMSLAHVGNLPPADWMCMGHACSTLAGSSHGGGSRT